MKITCLKNENKNTKALALQVGGCIMGWKPIHIKIAFSML
jgi:hypothetical protein